MHFKLISLLFTIGENWKGFGPGFSAGLNQFCDSLKHASVTNLSSYIRLF